jgi:hypothetical protein
MGLKSEIFEQPLVLAHLLEDQMKGVQEIAHAIAAREIDFFPGHAGYLGSCWVICKVSMGSL